MNATPLDTRAPGGSVLLEQLSGLEGGVTAMVGNQTIRFLPVRSLRLSVPINPPGYRRDLPRVFGTPSIRRSKNSA